MKLTVALLLMCGLGLGLIVSLSAKNEGTVTLSTDVPSLPTQLPVCADAKTGCSEVCYRVLVNSRHDLSATIERRSYGFDTENLKELTIESSPVFLTVVSIDHWKKWTPKDNLDYFHLAKGTKLVSLPGVGPSFEPAFSRLAVACENLVVVFHLKKIQDDPRLKEVIDNLKKAQR